MGFRTSSARRSSAQSTVASSIVVLPPIGGLGPTLSGGGITANTVVQTQIVQAGQTSSQSTSTLSSVKVTNVFVTDSNFTTLDDTALDPAGGYLKIVGTGFASGCAVYLNGSSVTTTFISSTELRVTTPATVAGTYNLMVFNSDGNGAIYLNLGVSNFPAYTTSAGSLGTVYETNDYTQSVVATGDAPLVYSLYSGSLPPNATLSSNGVISGTSDVENASNTYSFVVNVKDAQGQDSTRSFSLTILSDVVSWSSPANNSTITLDGGSLMSNVTLSATSATGKTITYTANTLPTGVTLSGNTISGTPTTQEILYTELTATANTTNRTAKRYVSWVINLGDVYFSYVSLLLSAKTTVQVPSFINDNSTNKFEIIPLGDTRASNFNPYQQGYYSNYFDGSGDYLSFTGAGSTFNNDNSSSMTIEFWACAAAALTSGIGFFGYGTLSNGYSLLIDGSRWVLKSASGTDRNVFVVGFDTSNTPIIGKWQHYAIVFNTGNGYFYLDGKLIGSGTLVTSTLSSSTFSVGNGYSASYIMNGHISNFRVVKGSALYSGTSVGVKYFTSPTAPLTAIANTQLLTCQDNRFLDRSTNNFTLTRSGDVTVNPAHPFVANTSHSTYGSGYFDGTGDYLNIASTGAINIGTNDFTLEGWVYRTATTSYQTFFSFNHYTTGILVRWETTVIGVYIGSTAYSFSLPDRIPLNVWTHVAMVRTNGVVIIYFNGVEATRFNSTYSLSITSSNLGRSIHNSTELWNGYISDVRLVANTALYTSNTAPPTAPLTAVANTQLLTLQTDGSHNNSNFKDESCFNALITRNGNVTNGAFSPYGAKWSNYFDGSGDFLSIPTTGSQLDATGDFTTEMWIYWNSMPTTGYQNICGQGAAGQNSYGLYAANAAGNTWSAPYKFKLNIANVGDYLTGDTTLVAGQWYHLAHTRTSGVNRLFVNGVLQSGTYTDSTSRGFGGNAYTIGNNSNCYISNFRYIKGTSLYTATFTPPTEPLSPVANTSLLTCQDNRLIDESINNLTITKNGDVSVRAFAPFVGVTSVPTSYSVYFDGSGDQLTTSSISFTGNYTVELWFYATTQIQNFPSLFAAGTNLYLQYAHNDNPGQRVRVIAGTTISPTTTVTNNAWHHFAVVRSGSTVTVYVDGTNIATATDSSTIGGTVTIGGQSATAGTLAFAGYISNVRAVNGTAVYTSNFTPSTTPLTAIANTSLLTCQSSTIIDNSTNYFTLTAVGDTKPRVFNPFGQTNTTKVPYYPTTFGGSMYFDGSGDYLVCPASAGIAGTGYSWTIQGWFYQTSVGAFTKVILDGWNGGTTQFLLRNNSNYLEFYLTGGVAISTGANAIVANQWYHFAIVKDVDNSNTVTMYLNGIKQGTSLANYTTSVSSGTFGIGGASNGGSEVFPGYISDVQIIKGTALYRSNFVPPVSPLLPATTVGANTVISNLFLPGSLGGVIDATRGLTIETSGAVRVTSNTTPYASTSQSYYFDGSSGKLIIPASPNLSFGTGDFTIEFWMKTTDTSAGLITSATTGSGYWALLLVGGTLYWQSAYNASNLKTQSMSSYLNNAWVHVAIVRSSSSMNFYFNGQVQGTATSDTTNYNGTANGLTIGQDPQTNGYYLGYLADLRITKGYARYTTNFTVPATPLSEK
jgi:hypothetical protein